MRRRGSLYFTLPNGLAPCSSRARGPHVAAHKLNRSWLYGYRDEFKSGRIMQAGEGARKNKEQREVKFKALVLSLYKLTIGGFPTRRTLRSMERVLSVISLITKSLISNR